MRSYFVLFLLLIGLVVSFAVGCSTTGQAEGEVTAPIPGGTASIRFRVSADGTSVADVDAEPNNPKICLRVIWSDKDGKDIGEPVTTEAPAQLQVPPGAVRWSAELVPCPTDGAHSGTPGASTPKPPRNLEAEPHLVQGASVFSQVLPVALIEGPVLTNPNLAASQRVHSLVSHAPSDRAHGAALAALRAGWIGSELSPHLEINYAADAEPVLNGIGVPVAVRLRQAVHGEAFVQWEARVNGVVFDSNDANAYHLPEGWHVRELVLPLEHFNLGGPVSDNGVVFTWTTTSGAVRSARTDIRWTQQ